MRVLVADDDPVYCCLLEESLKRWGYRVQVVHDGMAAWDVFGADEPPGLGIIDWMMPGLNGLDLCQRIRSAALSEQPYLILLTAKQTKDDVIVGLDSGADDYLVKPFDDGELHARLRVGERILNLQRGLAERVAELERALAEVQVLRGLLPICAYCKKVRTGEKYWQQVEAYVMAHLPVRFSHGICPECTKKYFGTAS